jgi:hypothetical protein
MNSSVKRGDYSFFFFNIKTTKCSDHLQKFFHFAFKFLLQKKNIKRNIETLFSVCLFACFQHFEFCSIFKQTKCNNIPKLRESKQTNKQRRRNEIDS